MVANWWALDSSQKAKLGNELQVTFEDHCCCSFMVSLVKNKQFDLQYKWELLRTTSQLIKFRSRI